MLTRNMIYHEIAPLLAKIDFLRWKEFVYKRYHKRKLDDLEMYQLEEFFELVKSYSPNLPDDSVLTLPRGQVR